VQSPGRDDDGTAGHLPEAEVSAAALSDAELVVELVRRRQARADGRCDACDRPWWAESCHEVDRHAAAAYAHLGVPAVTDVPTASAVHDALDAIAEMRREDDEPRRGQGVVRLSVALGQVAAADGPSVRTRLVELAAVALALAEAHDERRAATESCWEKLEAGDVPHDVATELAAELRAMATRPGNGGVRLPKHVAEAIATAGSRHCYTVETDAVADRLRRLGQVCLPAATTRDLADWVERVPVR
jgi:hypothetical protein